MGIRWSTVALVLTLLPATASAANHVVTAQSNFTFSPKNLAINAGDTVTFQNGGGFHNVTSNPGSVTAFRCANGCDGAGGNGNLSTAPWSATVTFPTAGTIGYFCEAHGSSNGSGMAGTITVSAAATSLSVSDAGVVEGNGGTRLAVFTITLSPASGSAVTFNVATANGTAIAGSDYAASSLTGQSIPAGTTSRTFNVTINGDTTPEANETFNVNVTNVAGATVVDGVGAGTILNDDVTARRSDFNGDGKSDVLWRNSSTGGNAIWRSGNSATPQAVATVADVGWVMVGVGDFSGDDKSDILWRHSSSGGNAVWHSANSATGQILTGVSNLQWKIVGAGDFNGDGKSDILWRNSSTGANVIWRSASAATLQSVTTVADLGWVVVGVGDFSGDGKSDILWRHSSSGANAVWHSANSATGQVLTVVSDLQWKIVGVGDFNGDGKSDILWRHSGTGANAIWRSGNSATLQTVTTIADGAWTVAMVGDLNADGRSDIVWRHGSTGGNAVWYSASSAAGQGLTAVSNLQWKIIP